MNIDPNDNNALPTSQPSEQENPFGPVIYTYTRAQALADGAQVDVSKTASEAGIRFPVFLTREVYDQYVSVPQGVQAQDEAGRLWDVIHMLRMAICRCPKDASSLPFQLYVRNDNRRPRLVTLFASCGPRDIDDPKPAITILMPNQD